MPMRVDEKVPRDRAPALLVDDQTDVLVVISAFLDAAGFDVTRANNGDEAMALLASGRTFALLVTDYAMPGLNGVDLAYKALQLIPALKVLIITGFPTDQPLVDHQPNIAVLAKPFRRGALIARLESLFAAEKTIPPTFPKGVARATTP